MTVIVFRLCGVFLAAAVVKLVCTTRWKEDGVTYMLGYRSDVNSSAAASTVCYVSSSLALARSLSAVNFSQ